MFELRTWDDEHRDQLVRNAGGAREAGDQYFQVFLRPDDADERLAPERERDEDFETARLVELLEAENWTLENIAPVREHENEWAGGPIRIGMLVGTIYTFRANENL
jgi:hypothetical protein